MKTNHTRLSKWAISTDLTHRVETPDKMRVNQLPSLSHHRYPSIETWRLSVQQHIQMPRTLTYIPDSDEEQVESRGRKSTGE
jgi:hypothetical protein